MPLTGFELVTLESDRPQTLALYHSATGTGLTILYIPILVQEIQINSCIQKKARVICAVKCCVMKRSGGVEV
jgi:hypothetical protein